MNWKFWKKDELAMPDFNSSYASSELGLKQDLGLQPPSTGLDLSGQFEPSNQPAQPSFSQLHPLPPSPPQANYNLGGSPGYTEPPAAADHSSKDLEIIAAKLDTIRAQLDMLNTRLANLERQQEQNYPKRPWY